MSFLGCAGFDFEVRTFFVGVVMEVAKHELTVSTPEASLVQPVARQPLELSRRSRVVVVGLRDCLISTFSNGIP